MNIIRRNIPNTLTLLNLLCGCMGAIEAFRGNFAGTFYFMLGSLIFDFLDGFVARLLNSYSEIGKELDSLADVVSFGLVPGLVLWRMGGDFAPAAFLVTLFSAYRLAKFNLDTREHTVFYGLATPANALFFVSLGVVAQTMPESWISLAVSYEWVRLSLAVLFSLLMVCNLPMFSLKFKSFGFRENALAYCSLLLAAAIVLLFGMRGVVCLVPGYILLSFGQWIFRK